MQRQQIDVFCGKTTHSTTRKPWKKMIKNIFKVKFSAFDVREKRTLENHSPWKESYLWRKGINMSSDNEDPGPRRAREYLKEGEPSHAALGTCLRFRQQYWRGGSRGGSKLAVKLTREVATMPTNIRDITQQQKHVEPELQSPHMQPKKILFHTFLILSHKETNITMKKRFKAKWLNTSNMRRLLKRGKWGSIFPLK